MSRGAQVYRPSESRSGVKSAGTVVLDDRPLVVDRQLAKRIGLNRAIVLRQIHYWLEINREADRNYIDGRYWTYNSLQDWWQKEFSSLWSYSTTKRAFLELEKMGLLITGNYNKSRFDKTKWYTIDYQRWAEIMADDDEVAEPIGEVESDHSNGSFWTNRESQTESIDCAAEGQPIPKTSSEKEPLDHNKELPDDQFGLSSSLIDSLSVVSPKAPKNTSPLPRSTSSSPVFEVAAPNLNVFMWQLETSLGRPLEPEEGSELELLWAKFHAGELFWQAGTELLHQLRKTKVARPVSYLRGILENWQRDGVRLSSREAT